MAITNDYISLKGTRVVAWKVTESTAELQRLLDDYAPSLSIEGCEKAVRELTVEHLLLHYAYPDGYELRHNEHGAPYLASSDDYISFSHSGGYVVLAINGDAPVGIDIEYAADKAIRVRRKYINDAEAEYVLPADGQAHLVAWTAKEALFKAIPEDRIDFREQFHLDFSTGLRHYRARETRSEQQRQFAAESSCEIFEGYVLTVLVQETEEKQNPKI